MISPVQFIPVAEETRLVIPMTRWVLEEACGFMQRLRRDFPGDPLSVGVNLSTVEFADASIVTDIRRILESSGLPPGALAVEITESAMMENAEEAAAMLSALRSDGVAVHVDDFGTGYSSLAYLHRFPVDRLKVDRSFVSRMDADASNLGIVRAIITLAHDLGQRVVAEGVESASQMNVLRSIGCEYAQGYYLAKPVPEDALRALLASGRTF
jgi:EAL domain-containing protein (putative c-di-GMP-specific phosphodiesterase class I)